MKFFERFSPKRRLRLHLGKVCIAPRADLLHGFEDKRDAATEADLRLFVSEWLEFPAPPQPEDAQESDIALDIVVSRHRLGQVMFGEPIPVVGWRPMIEVSSRAYFVRSGKELAAVEVIHRMPWSQFAKRALRASIFMPFTSKDDMYLLMGATLQKLLLQLKRLTG